MKVKCIDDNDQFAIGRSPHDFLVKGDIYQVVSADSTSYYIESKNGQLLGWRKNRFEVVQESTETPAVKRVKCIDDKNAYGSIINGHIYTVHSESSNDYRVESEISHAIMGWYKSRFVVVDDDATVPASPVAKSSSTDIEEEKCWQLLKPSRAKDECACGTKKSLCSYHQ